MRIRKKISAPQPSVEFVGTVLEDHPIADLIATRLSADGAIFILGFISELRLIHLELSVIVSIPIGFGDAISEGRRFYVPLANSNFQYNGEEGLMFASTFRYVVMRGILSFH
ncbi:hypothetical protein DL93DRAFT_2078065 [Clavulina sp. PMI_390]|nr:hypothetical protein DL93DRAFT_2078065 [Clavulina sp. PMI_390]